MVDGADDADGTIRFFDEFPRFLETSKTGPSLNRINARYTALIHRHRHLLEGATVLDLGSHDGRFTLAALRNGAAHVVGIEVDPEIVAEAEANMATYGVPADRYEFVQRDMFRHFDDLEQFDVVFCFGILYHVNNHMQLLTNIAGVEPRWLIVDTNVSQVEGAVIELRSAIGASPPPPGSHLEGYPSRMALDAMLSSFGWESEHVDWAQSGLLTDEGTNDYRDQRRVSVLVKCNDRVTPEVREHAVGQVRARQRDRRMQWLTIKRVAAECGMSPHALRTWVLRAEGDPPESLSTPLTTRSHSPDV